MTGLVKNIGDAKSGSLSSERLSSSPVKSRPVDTPAVNSNGRVANSRLAVSLQRHAETLLSDGMPDSAISLLATALMIDPGRIALVHKIGQCLDAIGCEKEASYCYRGSVPDIINEQYLNSSSLVKLIKPAVACESVKYLRAFDAEKIELKSPVRNTTARQYGQFNYQTTEARETFCTVANNGSVWFDGFNTIALDSKRHIIQEHTIGNEFSSYHAMKVTEAHRLNGTVCFLDGRSSKIYYHWILDILPKFGVMEKAGIRLEDIDYFLVSAKSTFQLDTLRALGVSEDQIVFESTSSLYQADKMIVPSLRNDLGERLHYAMGVGLGSWIPAFLQKKLGPVQSEHNADHSLSEPSESDKNVRVYISRSSRGSRNIANEAAIIEALQSRGFTTVEFERLTVVQQAELMSRAEIVVGVHGAGFTNLSYCKPGTRVIEIFGDYVVPCYWALCAVAGLEYAQFMAKSVSNSAGDSKDNSIADDNPGQRVAVLRDKEIEIDVEAFINYFDTTLGDILPAENAP